MEATKIIDTSAFDIPEVDPSNERMEKAQEVINGCAERTKQYLADLDSKIDEFNNKMDELNKAFVRSLEMQIRGNGTNQQKMRDQVKQIGSMADNLVKKNRENSSSKRGTSTKKTAVKGQSAAGSKKM